jgi:hypothetical protein
MVVAERVAGSDRSGTLVDRVVTDQPVRPGMGERVDGPRQALLRQALGLTLSRPEARPPEEALGLGRPERAAIDGEGTCGGDAG